MRVRGVEGVEELPATFETLVAVRAVVRLLAEVRGAAVRVQVGALREGGAADVARERTLACTTKTLYYLISFFF